MISRIQQNPSSVGVTRPVRVIQSAHKYLGAARNLGVESSNGEYVYFLDDDNVAKSNALSTYVRAALLTGSDEITAAHEVFTTEDFPEQEDVTSIWIPLGDSLSVGLFKNSFGDANFMIKKSAFLSVGGFTEEVNIGQEDHEFHAQLVMKGLKQSVIPEPLLYYRMHGNDQMIMQTDQISNQMRSIRPYSAALNDADSILRVLANRNTFFARASACNETAYVVEPTRIPTTGSKITIKGYGMLCAGVTKVQVGGVDCTDITVTAANPNQVVCTAGAVASPANNVQITVTFGSGTIVNDIFIE